MKILGIDPGIARTGWGVIESHPPAGGSKLKAQNYGCIETSAGLKMELRLSYLYDQLTTIIKREKPEVAAVEDLFFNTNAKTALIVGQARGVVLLCASQNQLPVFVYTPLQVKMALTGYGRAEKNQIGQMVKVLLKLKTIPKPDDAADALAVALTHAFTQKWEAHNSNVI